MAYSVPDALLLPVETLNREFDGKLLLALCAAERGLRPVIGGRAAMHAHLPVLPRSIYLSKGVRSGNRPTFALLEKLGHTIAAVDEEALVRFSDELFLMKLDPDAFPRARLLFAWGEDNAAVWKRSHWYAGAPIVISGNPRTDMMRSDLRAFYAPETEDLRHRFGDFVLINSNFSTVNHFIPGMTRFKVADWVAPEDSDQFRAGMLCHKRTLFERFLAAVPALADAIAPRMLVIRPHPSENAAAWKAAAEGLPNVAVLHEGPVVPWLAAARTVIHNGCTSAVEAAAIGTPALAFRPVLSDAFDIRLPNALSEDCRDLETLIDRTRAILRGDIAALDVDQGALLRHHLAGLDGLLCSERIVDALFEHRAALAQAPGATWRSRLDACLTHGRRQLRRRLRDRRHGGRQSAYTAHKFSGIEAHWVEERVARFRRTLGRFEGLQVRQIHKDIFAVEHG